MTTKLDLISENQLLRDRVKELETKNSDYLAAVGIANDMLNERDKEIAALRQEKADYHAWGLIGRKELEQRCEQLKTVYTALIPYVSHKEICSLYLYIRRKSDESERVCTCGLREALDGWREATTAPTQPQPEPEPESSDHYEQMMIEGHKELDAITAEFVKEARERSAKKEERTITYTDEEMEGW